jgi:hypothetical protein
MTTIREQLEAIITVPAFKAWLETQDPAEGYSYFSNQNCVVAQFFKAQPAFQALIQSQPNPDEWGVGGDDVRVGKRLSSEDNTASLPWAIHMAAVAVPRTFGQVLVDLDEEITRGDAAE